eukprot:12162479-Ditylum_brightwellii.AAC.1
MNQFWLEHGEEENWGILLIDAKNTLNQINHRVMLWEKEVLRGQEGLILSKEGVTQGNPLKKQLQEWFADNSALAGFYAAINH